MVKITVNEELCTGCMLCKEICPKGYKVWGVKEKEKGGKKVAVVIDASFCLFCANCVTRCPTKAIKIEI